MTSDITRWAPYLSSGPLHKCCHSPKLAKKTKNLYSINDIFLSHKKKICFWNFGISNIKNKLLWDLFHIPDEKNHTPPYNSFSMSLSKNFVRCFVILPPSYMGSINLCGSYSRFCLTVPRKLTSDINTLKHKTKMLF